jgi:hypothetical protein
MLLCTTRDKFSRREGAEINYAMKHDQEKDNLQGIRIQPSQEANMHIQDYLGHRIISGGYSKYLSFRK